MFFLYSSEHKKGIQLHTFLSLNYNASFISKQIFDFADIPEKDKSYYKKLTFIRRCDCDYGKKSNIAMEQKWIA